MHDVCTEQHVGNVKCASLPLSSSPSLSRSSRRSNPRSSSSRACRAKHQRSSQPPWTNERGTATPRGVETRVTAASRPSVGSGVYSFWQWRGGCVHGTARIPSRRGQRGGGEGREGNYDNRIRVLRCLLMALRRVTIPEYWWCDGAEAQWKPWSSGSSGFWCLSKNNTSFALKFVLRL